MLSHCLKYKTDTESKIPNFSKTNHGIFVLSKCAVLIKK